MDRVSYLNPVRAACVRGRARHGWRRAMGAAVAGSFVALFAASASAQPEAESISVELNKLEAQGQDCRAYVVVNNTSETAYSSFKLDLVMFEASGVIGRRFAIDLAPVRPNKKTVKLFDIDQTNCDSVASFLVNEVMECKTEAGPVENCLARIKASSLTKAQLSK